MQCLNVDTNKRNDTKIKKFYCHIFIVMLQKINKYNVIQIQLHKIGRNL